MIQQVGVHTKGVLEIPPCHIFTVLEARWAFNALCHLDCAAAKRQDGIVECVPRHVGDLVGLKKSLKAMVEFMAMKEWKDTTMQLRISVMATLEGLRG
jgi:hypothetical protein